MSTQRSPHDIRAIAELAGLGEGEIQPWGFGVAKVLPETAFGGEAGRGKLVLVTAISPTPAGVGKTTCSIGLTDAARRNGVKAVCALRQPSLGPVFGVKGGGAGGGKAMLIPQERINLHLTGDIHAVTAAHDLLAALVDNAIYFGEGPRPDPRAVTWRRVLDMNDRFLRRTVIGLGGKAHGVPREDGFDITAASEVMAVLCLSSDWSDLRARLGRIVVGYDADGRPVTAHALGAEGAMAALLRDALLPNIVSTYGGSPAFVHGGPFGNIAHGCSSVVATRLAMRKADLVFTEAGFGADLGAEKFLNIKCRSAGIFPHAVVLVCSLGALRYHGGASAEAAKLPDLGAVERGMGNLDKHIENMRGFGVEPVVALNRFDGDPAEETGHVLRALADRGVAAGSVDVYGRGGEGATELAALIYEKARAAAPAQKFTYELSDSPYDKIRKLSQAIYGARDAEFAPQARSDIERAVANGFGELPVCVAKTHLSLTDDPKKVGRPRDFVMTVREVRVSAGAGFLVPLTGEILTMPGLPKKPHSSGIDLLPDGTIVGAV